MPITVLIRAGGVAAVLVAPLGVSASASGNTIAASWLAGPVPGLIKGVRIYGQRVSEAADPYEPATWTLLEYLNTGTNFVDRSYIWDRDPINLRFCYVGVDNGEGPFTFVSNLSVIWGPLNQLSLYNQDLTQSVWIKDAGTTATGAAGSQTVTFTAANQAVNQKTPAVLNGQTYTFYYRVQGTSGQTIQFSVFDADAGSGADQVVNLDGTVQDVVFTRTIATTGHTLGVGPNTYGTATARSMTIFKTALSNGTFTQAQMIANWELTQGPGSTRQEIVRAVGPVTLSGWYHNPTTSFATIEVVSGDVTITGARISGKTNLMTVYSNTGTVTYTNSRAWGMHPMIDGAIKGYHFDTAYAQNLIVENNSFRGGQGIRHKYGRPGTTVRVRNNVARDLDGRVCTSVGGYVRSSYSNIQNRPPGAVIGNYVTNFFQTQGSNDYLNPPQGIDVDRNEVMGRPGYGKVEDVISFVLARGSAVTPYFCRNNLILNANLPWDFIWHDSNNVAVPYNYGNVATTFNLLFTVAAAGAAIGATSIPMAADRFLLSGVIPTGTVLTFTGGKTATVNGNQGGYGTALTVNALAAALNAGDTATITNFVDGSGYYSGTSIMGVDGIMFPVNVASSYEKQARWGRIENNVTVGPSAIQSLCGGGDVEIRGGDIVQTASMYGGTISDDGSRAAFLQLNTFGNAATTALDSGSVARVIWQNAGSNTMRLWVGSGSGLSSGPGDVLPSFTYGNKAPLGVRTWKNVLVQFAAPWRAEAAALGLTIGPTS